MARTERPLAYAESIVPYLPYFRKILHAPSSSVNIDRIPARGTTMRVMENLGLGLDCDGCSDTERNYIFSHIDANRAISENLLALYFVKDLSGHETDVVHTEYSEDDLGWPPVLGSVLLCGIAAAPGGHECVGGATSPTLQVLDTDTPSSDVRWTRDAYSGPTKLKHEFFLSNNPLAVTNPVPQMYGRSIHFDRRVLSVSIPPCLHIQVTVPDMFVETPGGQTGTYSSQNFPATIQTDWVDYEKSISKPQFVDGLWMTVKTTALKPNV